MSVYICQRHLCALHDHHNTFNIQRYWCQIKDFTHAFVAFYFLSAVVYRTLGDCTSVGGPQCQDRSPIICGHQWGMYMRLPHDWHQVNRMEIWLCSKRSGHGQWVAEAVQRERSPLNMSGFCRPESQCASQGPVNLKENS